MRGKREQLDQPQTMDLLCNEWIGQEGVHGFENYDELVCLMLEKNEKIEAKIQRMAGEHKVKFKYGPPKTAADLTKKGVK